MSFRHKYLLIPLLVSYIFGTAWSSQQAGDVIDSVEEDGYFRREYSLVQPYHGIKFLVFIVIYIRYTLHE